MVPWASVGEVIVNGMYLLLLVLIWHRRNWARWAILVWCAIGWVVAAVAFAMINATTFETLFGLVVIALQVWACQQLLSRTASTWFRSPSV
jgi:uncharacterized membrane protein YfcA